ncbi:MAG: NAD(P)H-hydrate dehydratase [Planctomycetota bacterium]
MQPQLPPRSSQAHKGDFGKVLILGGSESMPGAPALSGLAALRTGAGLVTIATSREAHPITASFSPALMTAPLPSCDGLIATTYDYLQPLLERADCVAVGPGLGQSAALRELLTRLYNEFAGPMVVDADGLNNLAVAGVDWSRHAGPRILTPHLGEFQRLLRQTPPACTAHPHDSELALKQATDFAREHQVVLLVKGPATLVTDGAAVVFNPTGNSGMATAGSGDVLTGIIAALSAAWTATAGSDMSSSSRGPSDSAEAARLALLSAVSGAYLHGMAGDLAAADCGETALISSDIPDYLGRAIRQMGGR